jgi:hypothetical protein
LKKKYINYLSINKCGRMKKFNLTFHFPLDQKLTGCHMLKSVAIR